MRSLITASWAAVNASSTPKRTRSRGTAPRAAWRRCPRSGRSRSPRQRRSPAARRACASAQPPERAGQLAVLAERVREAREAGDRRRDGVSRMSAPLAPTKKRSTSPSAVGSCARSSVATPTSGALSQSLPSIVPRRPGTPRGRRPRSRRRGRRRCRSRRTGSAAGRRPAAAPPPPGSPPSRARCTRASRAAARRRSSASSGVRRATCRA